MKVWWRAIADLRGELCTDILLERSLLAPLPEAKPRVDVQVRLATIDDLDTICTLYSNDPFLFLGDLAPDGSVPPSVKAQYRDRLDRGEQCFLAYCDGQIAHINWTCFTCGDTLAGRRIWLQAHEVYTTDAVTPEPFRGKNIHAFVLRAMLEHARSLGRTLAYTLAGGKRIDGHKGLSRLGWQEIGRVHYWLYGDAYKSFILCRTGRVDALDRAPPAASPSS